MPRTATIQARIDPIVKEEAQNILNKLNISLSEAISLYFTQISLTRGIPFDIKIPNEMTLNAVKESEDVKDLPETESVDELFRELED